MWVLGKGLQSPEDYQIGPMMNQVLSSPVTFVQKRTAASCESVPYCLLLTFPSTMKKQPFKYIFLNTLLGFNNNSLKEN